MCTGLMEDLFRRIGGTHRLLPGTTVLEQEGKVTMVYLLDSGLMKLSRMQEDGREAIVGFGGPASLIGVADALLGSPSVVSAITVKACRVQFMPCKSLFKELRSESSVATDLLHAQCISWRESIVRISDLSTMSAEERLLQFIDGLATDPSKPYKLQLPVKDYELAAYLAVTPSHLSRVLKNLERRGQVKRIRGWIVRSGFGGAAHREERSTGFPRDMNFC